MLIPQHQPRLVNNLTLERAANLGRQQASAATTTAVMAGGGTIPAPALPNMNLPTWSWPSFSFFEILIIFFAVWVGFELYRRYQKQKERFRKEGKAQKSRNLLDVLYDFITDRREYYNDNLDYLQ